ncbi:MAG TPA: hypothetical protein VM032_14960 [Vicinamibacterales bacterium]|nr:hypothetical protein [Vicinamibacterales bacterium]
MPGLCLSVSQAARLWNLDAQTSAAALHVLADHGFLSQTGDGRFVGAQWATRPAGSRSRSLGD